MDLDRFLGHNLRFHVSVVVGVLFIVFAMAAATVTMTLSVTNESAVEDARKDFSITGTAVRRRMDALINPALDAVDMAAAAPSFRDSVTGTGLEHPAFPILRAIIATHPHFYSTYAGFSNGTFLQLINPQSNSTILSAHDAPPETELIVRSIVDEGPVRVQNWMFLNGENTILETRREVPANFDPRARPWYTAVRESPDATVLSEPYIFHSLGEAGITASRRLPDGVVGVDLTAAGLEQFILNQLPSPNGAVALYAGDHWPIATTPNSRNLLADWDAAGGRMTNENDNTILSGDRKSVV